MLITQTKIHATWNCALTFSITHTATQQNAIQVTCNYRSSCTHVCSELQKEMAKLRMCANAWVQQVTLSQSSREFSTGCILAKVIPIYMKLTRCGLHVMLRLPVPPDARSEGPSSLPAALIRARARKCKAPTVPCTESAKEPIVFRQIIIIIIFPSPPSRFWGA